MTVSTTTARNRDDGNDVTVDFSFNFKILEASDLVVTLYDVDNVATVLTNGVDYVINTSTATGGTITMTVPPATGEILERSRAIPYTQEVEYREQDPFPAAVQEAAIDRLTMQIQQVKDLADRGVKVTGAADEAPDYSIPPPEAGKVIRGNSGGTAWENATIVDDGSITIPVPLSQGGHGGTTAAAGRTNLGLGSAAVLDTGTGAGEVPTNGDLGSASVEDVGTGAGDVVQLDGSARLPAVSGRNLADSRGFVLLVDQTVADAAGTVNEYAFPGLAAYDNYYIEILGLACDTTVPNLLMELYVDGALIGTGGTTGKMNNYVYFAVSGAVKAFVNTNSDAAQINGQAWFGTAANESYLECGLKVRNPGNSDFAGVGTPREWPQWVVERMQGKIVGDDRQIVLMGGSGRCEVPGLLTGFKFRWSVATHYFDGGIIRIYGYNGPLGI